MSTLYADTYEQLTDDEWELVETMIRVALNSPLEPVKRAGRKRSDPRPLLNAVLHHITCSIGLSSVSTHESEYPSGPTRRRGLDTLVDSGVLFKVFDALKETRPLLLEQYQSYKQMRGRYQSLEFKRRNEPSQLSWNTDLSSLPWFTKA